MRRPKQIGLVRKNQPIFRRRFDQETVEVSSDSNTSTNFSMSRNARNCARDLAEIVLLIRDYAELFREGSAKPVTEIFDPEAHENNRKPENLSTAQFWYSAKLVLR